MKNVECTKSHNDQIILNLITELQQIRPFQIQKSVAAVCYDM